MTISRDYLEALIERINDDEISAAAKKTIIEELHYHGIDVYKVTVSGFEHPMAAQRLKRITYTVVLANRGGTVFLSGAGWFTHGRMGHDEVKIGDASSMKKCLTLPHNLLNCNHIQREREEPP